MTNDPDPIPEPSVEIDLAEPCPAWRRSLPCVDGLCTEAARAALAAADDLGGTAAELSIVLADDTLIRTLNRQWRGQDAPTNVLAFSAREGKTPNPASPLPVLLGDVVLAYETVAAEAAAQGKPLADHLRHLVVHGVLHLLGYDHLGDEDAGRMEALEIRILAGLGVPDPYRHPEPALAGGLETSHG